VTQINESTRTELQFRYYGNENLGGSAEGKDRNGGGVTGKATRASRRRNGTDNTRSRQDEHASMGTDIFETAPRFGKFRSVGIPRADKVKIVRVIARPGRR